jgi:hypothetical protein
MELAPIAGGAAEPRTLSRAKLHKIFEATKYKQIKPKES